MTKPANSPAHPPSADLSPSGAGFADTPSHGSVSSDYAVAPDKASRFAASDSPPSGLRPFIPPAASAKVHKPDPHEATLSTSTKEGTHFSPPSAPSPQKTNKEKAGEKAIWFLYVLFFAVWLAGYWLGLSGHTATMLGLPVWFAISCLWAFLGVVLALLYVSRRFFS